MVHPPNHFRALALRSIRTARLPPTHSSHFHTLGLRLAAWYDIGNMGNYGQPEHYELPANGIGSKPKDHVTKTWDKNNIQNTYSYDGRETKMNVDALRRNGREEEEMGGAAITQRDRHGVNRRAQRDVPEAPGPVIGMNDERGAWGTINEPLGDGRVGMGTRDVPEQTNENLMKWKITDETARAGGRMDE